MFGSIRLVMVGLLITGIAGAGVYVMKLRSDNAILKANQVKLEEAVSSQKELIAKQQEDFKEILDKSKNEAGALDEVSDEEFRKILEDIRIETENEEDRYLQEIIIKLNDSELNHRDHSKIYSDDIFDNIEDSSIISIINEIINSEEEI